MQNHKLIYYIKNRFRLELKGIHGAPHWARVRLNGLNLAKYHDGIDTDVVELFAFLHDVERHDEYEDIEHGKRSAILVRELDGDLYNLSKKQLDLLARACENHSYGYLEDDITVMACWDADRLDLGRVGVFPDSDRLCLSASKDFELIEKCYWQSIIGEKIK